MIRPYLKVVQTALGALVVELRRRGHNDAADACLFALDMINKSVGPVAR